MTNPGNRPELPLAETVSRETIERLTHYEALLQKWSRRINLVAPGTLDESWSRHFADSAQILDLAPVQTRTWTDMGTGAGFPGLVVAIMRPEITVTLIESDERKSAFLRTVIRETGARANVLTDRIEDVVPQRADVVSARALAPLNTLLAYAHRHLDPSGTALFPKGRQFRAELGTALESWRFRCETSPSRTADGGVLLKLTEIARV